MVRNLLMFSLLAMSLAPSILHAQPVTPATPATPAPAAADAVNPAAIQALKDMGTYLLSLKRFQVSTELTGERVLADGQKLQHTATAVLDVERPERLRALMSSARSERELYYDGQRVTLYSPAQKYYSTVPFSGKLHVLVNQLEERYGVEIPLADLFVWGTPDAPFDGIQSAMNAGQDVIGQTLCDHYAFRQGNTDWQIWISTGERPLPRKLVITQRDDEARPQSVSLIDWNLKPTFTNAVFSFKPPKGAVQAELLPRQTK